MALTLSQVQLVAFMCQGIFHGVFFVLILIVVYIFRERPKIPPVQKAMMGITIIMFMLATAHLALVLIAALQLPNVSRQNSQTQASIALITYTLGDIILIWRAWVLWGKIHLVAVVPTIMLIVGIALGAEGVAAVTAAHPNTQFRAPTAILTVCTTGLCTALIVGRLWYMVYQLSKISGSATFSSKGIYMRIMLLLIESGAIYASAYIVSLVLSDVGNIGLHIVLDIIIPLEGIIPTLIVVLVHFDKIPGNRTLRQYSGTMGTDTGSRVSAFVAVAGLDTSASGEVQHPVIPTVHSTRSNLDSEGLVQMDWEPKPREYEMEAVAFHGQKRTENSLSAV